MRPDGIVRGLMNRDAVLSALVRPSSRTCPDDDDDRHRRDGFDLSAEV